LINKIKFKHLEEVNATYLEHMIFALREVFYMMLASLALIVHAIVPCVFNNMYSNFIKQTGKRINSFIQK
jgi:hypothetical protein